MERARARLNGFRPSLGWGLVIAFAFGVAVRLLPEVLSYPHAMGFDTVYYAGRLQTGELWVHWSHVFDSWLLYALLLPFRAGLRLEPFLVLKAAMPLLFGVTVAGVYYVATRGLGWSERKSLFAAGLFSFQMGILALSWQFYRNMLGLGLLLFALPSAWQAQPTWTGLTAFGVLSLLAVWGHEYAGVLLLASVAAVAASRWGAGAKQNALKVMGAAAPAIAVFVASVWLRVTPVYQGAPSNLLWAYRVEGYYAGPLFFLVNYLAISDTFQYYPTYLHLAASVVSLFAVLYAAVVPLAVVGFFRHTVLDGWTGLLGVGAFGCLAVPFFALNYWNRWMLLLVVPVTLYAAHGFARVLQTAGPVAASLGRLGSLRVSRRAAKGLVLASVTTGFVFMTSPMFLDRGGVFGLPTTVNYVPSTMQCNAVPLCDVDGVVAAFRWVDAAMDETSSCLAHDALFYWAQYALEEQHTLVFFKNDVWQAVNVAAAHGFTRCWLVWWSTDIGWYGFAVPHEFVEMYRAGRISVYEYSA
jgi:hypothetical protein